MTAFQAHVPLGSTWQVEPECLGPRMSHLGGWGSGCVGLGCCLGWVGGWWTVGSTRGRHVCCMKLCDCVLMLEIHNASLTEYSSATTTTRYNIHCWHPPAGSKLTGGLVKNKRKLAWWAANTTCSNQIGASNGGGFIVDYVARNEAHSHEPDAHTPACTLASAFVHTFAPQHTYDPVSSKSARAIRRSTATLPSKKVSPKLAARLPPQPCHPFKPPSQYILLPASPIVRARILFQQVEEVPAKALGHAPLARQLPSSFREATVKYH